MNNILAYDTSGENLSISLLSPLGVSHYRYEYGLRHGEILGERVQRALEDHKLEPKHLDGVLCSKGPGSFTGLRIGMSFAKGLSAALDIPVLSVSTLEAMNVLARRFYSDTLILTTIDGKKKRFFWALYDNENIAGGPADWPIDQILQYVEQKSFELQKPMVILNGDNDLPPLSKGLLEIGVPRLRAGERDTDDEGPDYLRESQAVEDKK